MAVTPPGNRGSSAAGVRAQVLDHGSQGRQAPLVPPPEDVLAALSTGGAGADDAAAAGREGLGRWTAVGR